MRHVLVLLVDHHQEFNYRGADKSLARPDWKNNWKVANFSFNAEVIAAAETWLDRQPSEFFLSGLQKLRVWSL